MDRRKGRVGAEQLHVLYLVPDLWNPLSGIGRHCRTVCRSLMEAGFALHVVSLTDSAAVKGEATQVHSLLKYYPCRGSKLLFSLNALKDAILWQPGLVLVGHPNLSPVGLVAARASNARFVVTIHGIDIWARLHCYLRWTLQRADRIISVSRFTAQQAVLSNGLLPERIRILYNSLDPAFEQPCGEVGPRGDLSLLTVARIGLVDQYKGHAYVIQAMPKLRARFPNLIYNVIGDGSGRPDLERMAAGLNVAEAIKFHGAVSEEVLARQYADADVFIMPSTGEGFGLAFLEAMAHGVPAIGGNRDATPEVIVDGETGFLIDPTSVEAIVDRVSLLLSDEVLRKRMGQAAARHVRKNFSYSIFHQTLQNHLDELLKPALN